MTKGAKPPPTEPQRPPVPEPIRVFLTRARADLPGCNIALDTPVDPAGEWWIDISDVGSHIPVSWRPGHGFGFFSSGAGFGEGPSEIISEAERAVDRLVGIARAATRKA